jgi:glycerol-3-phosphate dehydrogenase (NAD+)
VQGFAITEQNPPGFKLISEIISESLNIPCMVMMGANLAGEVANEEFCEATIGEGFLSPVSLFLSDCA